MSAIAQRSRREFFLGESKGPSPVRPVGALDEYAFRDACTECGDCARACQEKIIRRGKDGFPYIDFSRGVCTDCGKCTEACETGALSAETQWKRRAVVSSSCLSLNAVQCRTCEDLCEQGAIRFKLVTGGRAEPFIDHDDCTGCGECISHCPVQAVSLQKITETTEVHP